jgi:hypothetical protein
VGARACEMFISSSVAFMGSNLLTHAFSEPRIHVESHTPHWHTLGNLIGVQAAKKIEFDKQWYGKDKSFKMASRCVSVSQRMPQHFLYFSV